MGSFDSLRPVRVGIAVVSMALSALLVLTLGPSLQGRSAAAPRTAPVQVRATRVAPAQPALRELRRSPQIIRPAGIYNGLNRSTRVVLSFDDCPRSLRQFKQTVLAAERMHVGLVLFPTGTCLRRGTFDAGFARRHGHYVGNHSVHHKDLTRLSYQGVLAELGTQRTSFARPPFGAYNATVRRALAAKSMQMWLWDVDTNDWRGKSQGQVVSWAVSHSHRGSTVLMHMQHRAFNPSAIAQIKAGLARRGLKVCRPYPGTTPARPRSISC